MNRYYLLSAMMLIFIAGCVEIPPPVMEPGPSGEGPEAPECRIAYVEEPFEEEVCAEVIYNVEECDMKELEYTASQIAKTDLCIADGPCVGKTLYGNCLYACTRAMKRCQMNITNNDERLSGTWVVGATFTFNGAAFVKNPQSVLIPPGETHVFDFEQMYQLGDPVTVATCSVTVLYPAITRDCVLVERTRTECENITKTRIIQEEICD